MSSHGPRTRVIEGFDATTCWTALTEYYINTFVPGSRYLSAGELTENRDLSGVSTSFHQLARKAAFAMGGTSGTPRLTGTDTHDSVEALMNSATRIFVKRLVDTYTSTYNRWNTRGVSGLSIGMSLGDPVTVDFSITTSIRTTFLANWTILTSRVKTFMKDIYIRNSKTAYGLLTGSPSGTGKLARPLNTIKPIVATLDASGITFHGSQTNATSFGFVWSTSSMGAESTGTSVAGTAGTNGLFSASVSTFTSGTTYYYKAWATNTVGTVYGIERSFVYSVAPTVGTLTISRSPTSLSITGSITSGGGSRILEKGVAWATTAPANWITSLDGLATRTIEVVGDISGWTHTISGLVPGTNYTFVGYARTAVGAAVSAAIAAIFPNPPTVAASAATVLSKRGATMNGSITMGTGTITEMGFYYNTTSMGTDRPPSGTKEGVTICTSNCSFTKAISTLSRFYSGSSPTIYYIAYALSSDGNAYSDERTFTYQMSGIPSISGAPTTSSITTTGATFTASFTDPGSDASITSVGFLYSTSSITLPATPANSLPTGIDSINATLPTGSSRQFTATLSSLPTSYSSRTYNVIAYAQNADGYYGFSSNITFNPTQLILPTLSMGAISIASATVATMILVASYTVSGATPTLSECGFYFSTSSLGTPTQSTPPSGESIVHAIATLPSGSTNFSTTSTNISSIPGTTYYIRGYIKTTDNSYAYTSETTFTIPTHVVNTNFVSVSTNTTTLSGSIDNSTGNNPLYRFIYCLDGSTNANDANLRLSSSGTNPSETTLTTISDTPSLTLTTELTKGSVYVYRMIGYRNGIGPAYGPIRKFRAHQNYAEGGTITDFTPTASGLSCTGARCNTTYKVHTFNSVTTTFDAFNSMNVEFLLVGGGGGGATDAGGGGGGGGFVTNLTDSGTTSSTVTITPTASLSRFTVTAGVGGNGASGSTGNATEGTKGGDSSLQISASTTITATGGGGGGPAAANGGSGGSGGGKSWWDASSKSPGNAMSSIAGYVVKANAGGSTSDNNDSLAPKAGGGGGAGGTTINGNGGAGAISYIKSNTGEGYAAGGGGGYQSGTATTGGGVTIGGTTITLGGAGGTRDGFASGTNTTAGTSATSNTGSGGGGAGSHPTTNRRAGGNGSAGVVVIRYPLEP